MRRTFTALLAVAALAGGVAGASAADARPHGHDRHGGDYGRYDRRRDDNSGAAIAAGVVGLALGAALASGSSRGGYYDQGYYVREDYGPRYYAPRPVYRQTCRTTRYWDRYYGYVDRTRCW